MHRTVGYVRLVRAFQKDVYKEFQRQFRETMKYMNKGDKWGKLEAYSRRAHPELYDKMYAKREDIPEEIAHGIALGIEKGKAQDIEYINRMVKGWNRNVKPEKMNKVLDGYIKKAGELGGRYALDKMGISLAFDLKNPEIMKALKKRGTKITGKISKTTLNQFRRKLYNGYMKEGLSPYAVKKDITGMFKQTYKNRAWTIARTETGVAQSDVAHETYKKNKVEKRQWLATMDGKTRQSHRNVNRQVRSIDKRFSNGLLYPHDPNAPAEEVVNCRCSESPIVTVELPEDEIWTGE